MISRRSLLVLFLLTIASIAPNCFASDISGTYIGTVERGIKATLTLKILPDGQISVYLFMESSGCSGELEGKGTMKGSIITITEPSDCKLSLKVIGEKIKVLEENCMEWHGAACSFRGTYTKTRK